MAKPKADAAALKPATRLITAGREFGEHGIVSPAVYHASTILHATAKSLHDRSQPYVYGRRGTPTSRAAETAIATHQGGHDCKLCPSGLAAISTALLTFLDAGDQLLMVDTVYQPARVFCDGVLKRLGIETRYYDPTIGAGIARLIGPKTRVVYCESPGSLTMEVQDIPAIVAAAHAKGCVVFLDNTWSAGHYFDAFGHGCDIAIQAATKYLSGHSDVMLGAVICSKETWPKFKETYESMGQFAGPDDMFLALRGLRTLDVRLERHMKNGLRMAEWLAARPEVAAVLHPALPDNPGHRLWKRDFTGASSLFSVVLKPVAEDAVAAMLEGLDLFGMGYSWGGFESLAIPFKPNRTATHWTAFGPCLRFHIGLEDTDDLIDDLKRGFARMGAAA